MNLLVLLLAIILAGFLMFGKNPIREFQKEQKVLISRYGKDDLTIKTNLYIEQQKKAASSGFFSGGERKGGVASVAPAENLYGVEGEGEIVIQQTDPSGQQPSSPTTSAGLSMPPVAMRSPAKSSNYYPPIVSEGNVPSADKKPLVLTGNETRLRSGQIISFQGILVYMVDQFGDRSPLPDGDYNLQDGGFIKVRGGHRVAND